MFCLQTGPTNLMLKTSVLPLATGIYVGNWVCSSVLGSQLHRGRCSLATESPVVKIELKTWIGAKLSCSLLVLVPQFWGALQPAETMKHPWRNLGEEEFGIYLGTIFLRIGICIWNADDLELDQSSFRGGMLFDWSPEELWCTKLASNLPAPAPHLHCRQLMVLFMATSCGPACGQNKDLTAVLIMNWIPPFTCNIMLGRSWKQCVHLAHE